MPELVTRKQLQTAYQLRFCYLCGDPFITSNRRTKDHVAPKARFRDEDRSPPS